MAEQLNDLLEQLRHDGFSIGVPETLRLHQLLLALVDREVPLDTPERLTRLLGPVLCRSASQQEALGRHVAAWWPGLVPVPVAPAPADPPPAQTGAVVQELAAVERRRRRLLRWLPTTPAALAIWAAVATGVGVGGALELQRRQHRGTQPAPPPAQVTPARKPASARPSRPAPRPATRPATPAPTTPATPAAPVELARDNGLFLLPSEIAFLALLAVAMALVAVQGAIRGWWWRQARLVLQKLPHQGDGQLHRIALQAHDHDLVPAPKLQRLGRALNIWQRLPSDALDGDATVAASLRQGGWLSPRYGQRRRRLSYLFLLDQESLADQQTRLLQTWLEGLRLEGVLAEWVCFQRDPQYCHGPTGHGPLHSLTELAAQHPDAVAVVVIDGERCFSPVDGTLQPWLQQLAAWPRHALLTPRPPGRWGALEEQLTQHLPVLPASPEGLLSLGPWLEGAASGPLQATETAAPPEAPLLQGTTTTWLDRTPPAPEVVGELLAQLRMALGPDGLHWLAACGVFPQLHWSITTHLGQRLRNGAGEPLLQAYPLLRLARLPWLRHGTMPDWLRLSLIQELQPEQQTAVRQALAAMVLAAVDNGELQVATTQPRLLPPLLERLRRRAGPTSPLQDQLFLRFLQQRPLLAADAPESLRRLLRKPAGLPWLQLGRRELATASLLLLGVGALGLVALSQLQLWWVRQLLSQASAPPVAGEAASARLQRAITAVGLSHSSLMQIAAVGPEVKGVQAELAKGLDSPLMPVDSLKGHEGYVYSVAFSPDGRLVASGSGDKTVRLWDAKTGTAIGSPLKGHKDYVYSVAFSPDGRLVASGSGDKTVRLWDAKTVTAIGSPLKGHKDYVYSVAFSPDSRIIASGSADQTVRLWDAKSGTAIGSPLTGHEGYVYSVAFSPDGRLIASGSNDNTVRLWDAKTGAPVGSPLKGHDSWVYSVAFSPDSRIIASGSADQTVRLWDAKSGTAIGSPLTGHEDDVNSVAFSPDGRLIASGSDDKTVRLWDAKSREPIAPPAKGHGNWVSSVSFSPDGQVVASGSRESTDRTVRLWDAKNGLAIYKEKKSIKAGHLYPSWHRSLPIACNRLEFSPQLTKHPWLNTARATCQHFVWSHRPRAQGSEGGWLAPLTGVSAVALGSGGLASLAFLWSRQRRRGAPSDIESSEARKNHKDQLNPSKTSPSTPETWSERTAQIVRLGIGWEVHRRKMRVQGYRVTLGPGEDLLMVRIPAGEFVMGSPSDEPDRSDDESPQHKVLLGEFWMSQTPITQGQWGAVMGNNPSEFKDQPDSDQRPVEKVSWHDAIVFCRRLSERSGRRFTLPSEAQWEYACRAGTSTPFHFGDTITPRLANYDGSATYNKGPRSECRQRTTRVGMFPANAWGVQDMHGNVWEWCLDQWHDSYAGAPSDGGAWVDSENEKNGTHRLLRGGSWFVNPRNCRSAARYHDVPVAAGSSIGFRVICLPQDPSLNT